MQLSAIYGGYPTKWSQRNAAKGAKHPVLFGATPHGTGRPKVCSPLTYLSFSVLTVLGGLTSAFLMEAFSEKPVHSGLEATSVIPEPPQFSPVTCKSIFHPDIDTSPLPEKSPEEMEMEKNGIIYTPVLNTDGIEAQEFPGFASQYVREDRQPVDPNLPPQELTAFDQQLNRQIAIFLQNRPDLVQLLKQIPEDKLRVLLFENSDVNDSGIRSAYMIFQPNPYLYFNARSLALTEKHAGYNIYAQSLSRLLDSMGSLSDDVSFNQNPDGLLPGWNSNDIKRFTDARMLEQDKIRTQSSPLTHIAQNDNKVFLDAVVEAFFENPYALKKANMTLYTMMQEYFKLDTAPATKEDRVIADMQTNPDAVPLSKINVNKLARFNYLHWNEQTQTWDKSSPTEERVELSQQFLTQLTAMFEKRPDILYRIQNLLPQFTVDMHYPRMQIGGQTFHYPPSMRLSEWSVERSCDDIHDGYNINIHEAFHLADMLRENGLTELADGLLAEWTPEQVSAFEKAREEEKQKMLAHTSPISDYPLEPQVDFNVEFLPEVGVTFFEKPKELRDSNQVLFNMMQDYFRVNPFTGERHTPVSQDNQE